MAIAYQETEQQTLSALPLVNTPETASCDCQEFVPAASTLAGADNYIGI